MHLLEPLVAPVEPVDALTRIAWLLERDRQSTYRVQAFRRAAQTVGHLDRGALEAASRAHRLTEIDGIGATTATVIAQALAGGVPDYLADLQDTSGITPMSHGGHDLYAELRGDLHVHTDWSDGGAPLPEMVAAAADFGHEWVAITDHSPRLTVANGLDAGRLRRQIETIGEINEDQSGIRVLSGIEVDILDDGSLDQTDELLGRLDVVTASVHSKLRMPGAAMTERMLAAVRNRHVRVLGHCTGRRVLTGRAARPASEFDAERVFRACADNGVAVEINSRPERVDPPDDLIDLADGLGCLFAIDSDAHAPGQLDFKALGAQRAADHRIEPDRIVTTWDAERLLAWARG